MENKQGHSLFRQWIDDTGRRVAWVAAQIPISRVHLYNLLAGGIVPRQILRNRIEELTDGAVPADSWEAKE